MQNVRIHPYLLLETSSSSSSSTTTARPDITVVAEGWVESIEFKWEWGTGFGQGAKAYIQHVELRVRGVKLRIHQQEKQQQNTSFNTSTPTQATGTVPDGVATGDPDWKARYLHQIVDHLTLVLESVEISIDLPGQEDIQSTVVVVGKQMELITLGGSSPQTQGSDGDNNNGLRQRLSVGSLSAMIRQATPSAAKSGTDKHQELPLLDPVGYRAMVQRVSGRRFLDGIGAGLLIAGERILAGAGCGAQQQRFKPCDCS